MPVYNTMKFIFAIPTLFILALGILSDTAQAQQANNPSTEPSSEPSEAGTQMMKDFMALPEETRVEFNKNIRLAQQIYQQKRIFDALQAIDALDKVYKDHPACLGLRAGCYVELRAFKKAYAIFEKLHALSPKSPNISFNLAELEFVMKNWEAAHQRFSDLLTILPASNKSLIHLSEFKLLLCKLKTNRIDEARAMANKYGEWDDTPYYYYAKSALLFHDGKDEDAKKILREALFIWRDKGQLSSWQDTMIEFGYVRSFYGDQQDDQVGESVETENLTPTTPQIAPVIPLDTE